MTLDIITQDDDLLGIEAKNTSGKFIRIMRPLFDGDIIIQSSINKWHHADDTLGALEAINALTVLPESVNVS